MKPNHKFIWTQFALEVMDRALRHNISLTIALLIGKYALPNLFTRIGFLVVGYVAYYAFQFLRSLHNEDQMRAATSTLNAAFIMIVFHAFNHEWLAALVAISTIALLYTQKVQAESLDTIFSFCDSVDLDEIDQALRENYDGITLYSIQEEVAFEGDKRRLLSRTIILSLTAQSAVGYVSFKTGRTQKFPIGLAKQETPRFKGDSND